MNTRDLIKNVLREALGVPDNIHETSVNIFRRIVNWSKKLRKEDFKPGIGSETSFRGNFRIADFDFSTAKIKLGVEPHPKVKKPEMVSMTVSTESQKTPDFLLKNLQTKTVKIFILVLVPKKYDYEQLSNYFIENQNEIIPSLSHELKHAYDHYKKPFERPTERAMYQGVIGLGTDITPVDKFIHDLYFVSASENLVRPSEIVSAIKTNKISKEKFLEFLRDNDTHITLKRISNFNLQNFKREILEHKDEVKDFLKTFEYKPSKMSDEEKIQAVLNITYKGIVNATLNQYKEILKTSFLEEILGFEGEKQKTFEKFSNQLNRFKNNPEKFFEFYEKQFNYVGNDLLRKIYKLYALTGDK